MLIGFESEDDWFDYRLEHHPEFLRRVAEAREESIPSPERLEHGEAGPDRPSISFNAA